MNMTAAARSNRAAPMTVARGGHEGAPIPVTPTFSSRTAFTSNEGRYGKAMNTGANPLTRQINIGEQAKPQFSHMSKFSNPDRAAFMKRIHVDVPAAEKVLRSPATKEQGTNDKVINTQPTITDKRSAPVGDRAIAKDQARDIFRGKNAIVLYQRASVVKPTENVTKVSTSDTINPTIASVSQPLIEKGAAQAREAINKAPKAAEAKKILVPEIVKAPVKPTSNRAPSLSEIGLRVIKAETAPTTEHVARFENPKSTIGEMRNRDSVDTDTSLTLVRSAIQNLKNPVNSEIISLPQVPNIIQPRVTSHELVKPARKLSPLETIRDKSAKKDAPRPYVSILKNADKVTKVIKSVDSPALADKEAEKGLLDKYLSLHILPLAAGKTPIEIERNKEIRKKMVSHMTNPEKKDAGSQLETQLLGDTGHASEQVAMKKIEELVKETRAKIQIAKLQGADATLVEKKALEQLHAKIEQAGLLSIFTKIKLTVTQELTTATSKGTQETENNGVALIKKTDEEEETIDNKDSKKKAIKIELDAFADRFRRIFMKSRAQRALDNAKRQGRKAVSTAEIASEIGTYQYHFTKSEPVRYTKRPDGSITETLMALNQMNQVVSTADEANRVIDVQIDQKAPVKTTDKIKTKPRGMLDLIRVLGYPQELLHPAEAAA
jgi:hypothetical protein